MECVEVRVQLHIRGRAIVNILACNTCSVRIV